MAGKTEEQRVSGKDQTGKGDRGGKGTGELCGIKVLSLDGNTGQ